MSRWGKISWLLSGLALVILFAVRFILGGWVSYMFLPLAIFLVGLLVAIAVDFKFYIEFLTMRTTKSGMNMGAMIVVVITILVSMNYFSVRHNKTWDFTEEGLNSLAEQTTQVLDTLDKDLSIKVFYRGDRDKDIRAEVNGTLQMFEEASNKLKVRFVNAYVENTLAQEYLGGLADANQLVMFAEYDGKKVRVEQPFSEEKITSALIKATRKDKKKIYFLTGHGERDINSEDPDGIKGFHQALIDASFEVASLNLLETGQMPKDADVVAIVGPQTQLQEGELQLLRGYAKNGGNLFIAADPGQKHQIALLTKTLGVEFKNNYIINDRIQLMGRGAAGALGMVFDKSNEITKKFRSRDNFTLFDVATEVVAAADRDEGLKTTDLVRTPPNSFVVNDLKTAEKGGDFERRFYTIGVEVKGSLTSAAAEPSVDKDSKEGEDPKGGVEFTAVIFGDSDFVSQKDVIQGLNMDLALNSIAALAKEGDLVSIRPKQPKGTQMTLTSTSKGAVVLAGVVIPVVLLMMSGFFWFRRRSA